MHTYLIIQAWTIFIGFAWGWGYSITDLEGTSIEKFYSALLYPKRWTWNGFLLSLIFPGILMGTILFCLFRYSVKLVIYVAKFIFNALNKPMFH